MLSVARPLEYQSNTLVYSKPNMRYMNGAAVYLAAYHTFRHVFFNKSLAQISMNNSKQLDLTNNGVMFIQGGLCQYVTKLMTIHPSKSPLLGMPVYRTSIL